jgi:hypothetical protein
MLLGGVLLREKHQQVPMPLLREMAKAVSVSYEPIGVGSGSIGFFTTGGPSRIESAPDLLITEDLDLGTYRALPSLQRTQDITNRPLGALYRREGWRFVDRLRGGFAFALWDRRKQRLILAVDHFGIKKLHYVIDDSKFAFASHHNALLVLPGMERRFEPNVGNVHRLQPGQVLILQNDGIKLETTAAHKARGGGRDASDRSGAREWSGVAWR